MADHIANPSDIRFLQKVMSDPTYLNKPGVREHWEKNVAPVIKQYANRGGINQMRVDAQEMQKYLDSFPAVTAKKMPEDLTALRANYKNLGNSAEEIIQKLQVEAPQYHWVLDKDGEPVGVKNGVGYPLDPNNLPFTGGGSVVPGMTEEPTYWDRAKEFGRDITDLGSDVVSGEITAGGQAGGAVTGLTLGAMVPPPFSAVTMPLGAMAGYMAGGALAGGGTELARQGIGMATGVNEGLDPQKIGDSAFWSAFMPGGTNQTYKKVAAKKLLKIAPSLLDLPVGRKALVETGESLVPRTLREAISPARDAELAPLLSDDRLAAGLAEQSRSLGDQLIRPVTGAWENLSSMLTGKSKVFLKDLRESNVGGNITDLERNQGALKLGEEIKKGVMSMEGEAGKAVGAAKEELRRSGTRFDATRALKVIDDKLRKVWAGSTEYNPGKYNQYVKELLDMRENLVDPEFSSWGKNIDGFNIPKGFDKDQEATTLYRRYLQQGDAARMMSPDDALAEKSAYQAFADALKKQTSTATERVPKDFYGAKDLRAARSNVQKELTKEIHQKAPKLFEADKKMAELLQITPRVTDSMENDSIQYFGIDPKKVRTSFQSKALSGGDVNAAYKEQLLTSKLPIEDRKKLAEQFLKARDRYNLFEGSGQSSVHTVEGAPALSFKSGAVRPKILGIVNAINKAGANISSRPWMNYGQQLSKDKSVESFNQEDISAWDEFLNSLNNPKGN